MTELNEKMIEAAGENGRARARLEHAAWDLEWLARDVCDGSADRAAIEQRIRAISANLSARVKESISAADALQEAMRARTTEIYTPTGMAL